MKKNLFILSLLIFIMQPTFSQSYWMLSAGGTAVDEGADISVDAANNIYTTGYFSGTSVFATGVTLTANGATDIFISKVNDQGALQWVDKAGGIGPDRGLSIKTDAAGNCYVTGYYFGTATFGSFTISSVGGSQDVFIAKYNSSGIVQWVATAGGTEGESGNGISVDNSGNVLVTGQFSGTAQFGTISLTSATDPSNSQPSVDIFTAKLNSSGVFLWAKKGSAKYTDRGIDITTDISGNVYVTGQFSDTITFDNTYNNNMYNAIFLLKYNSSGQEQWFRKIGGSTMNIAYGIAADKNSNIYLTGDFIGSLIFFGTPNTQLTNSYPNNIFIAKYNHAGDLIWDQADGSNSDVSSRNIALDDSANAFIVGNFRCTFSEYADLFGQGTFNTVGYKDIFVAKYNSSGQRKWMRQGGGQKEDFGAGIAVNSFGQAVITGSFNDKIFFPSSSYFTYPNNHYFSSPLYPAYNGLYCNDSYYGDYCCINSIGASDILIAKAIDPSRQPYDYYSRTPGNCIRPYVGVCINTNTSSSYVPDNACDADSIEVCSGIYMSGSTNTSAYLPGSNSPGPYFNWQWSNGSASNPIFVNSSGNYAVTITSQDGCYSSSDTIYANVHPQPSIPPISDDYVVNTNALNPQNIHLCYPEDVVITGTPTAQYYYWTNGSGTLLDSALSITVTQSGYYYFYVIDAHGCKNYNMVHVIVDSPFDPLYPKMILYNDTDHDDSTEICAGGLFTILIYDTLSNPAANLVCINYASTIWTLNPSIQGNNYCNTWLTCYPTQSGYYQINATLMRINNCDTDVFVLNKTIYVTIYPAPTIHVNITGNTMICSGDTTILTACGASTYHWSGPGIISDPNQASIVVVQPGNYYVYSTLVDSNGCTASGADNAMVSLKPPPSVTMIPSSGLICPNDSVMLHCTGAGIFQWYSTGGPFGINTSSVYVSLPGIYYCVLTDTTGCVLVSNTVEVKNYATPYLVATPYSVICPGGNCSIQAITNQGSIIQWQPPLSGSSLAQTIYSPGIYTCNITSCGILTTASITVTLSNPVAYITPPGPLTICNNDSVLLTANSGMAGYQWSVPGFYNPYVYVSQAGTYTLTTTDAFSCKATDSIKIAVFPAIPPPVVSDTSICAGDSVLLHAVSSYPVEWYAYPAGGTPLASGSSFTTPALTITTIYYVQSADTLCNSNRILLTVTVYAPPESPVINDNLPLCPGDTLMLSTDLISGGLYQWSGPDGFSSSLQNPDIPNVSSVNSGTYSLTCMINGCQGGTAYSNIIINSLPYLDLGKDTIACFGELFTIHAGNFSDYIWQDGSTSSTFVTATDGTYYVSVTDFYGCKTRDSIAINFTDCSVFTVPNVFTPNDDGYNDYFSVYAPGVTGFYCRIYNRWGKLIYTFEDPSGHWDGNMQGGAKAHDGVYFYIIGCTDYRGEVKEDHGYIQLIR